MPTMISLPWILIGLMLFIQFPHQASTTFISKLQSTKKYQFDVDGARPLNHTVILDASHSSKYQEFNWKGNAISGHSAYRRRLMLHDGRQEMYNITSNHKEKMIDIGLQSVHGRRKSRSVDSGVCAEKSGRVVTFLSASYVVRKLLKIHYKYIALSQMNQRTSTFHPRVAKYFRNLAKSRLEMADNVMEYVHEMQAEHQFDPCPTDYVTVMVSRGFVQQIRIEYYISEYMTSAFESALESEASLAEDLSLIVHHARTNDFKKLAAFAAVDLLPQVTKVMKDLASYLETTLRPFDNAPMWERQLAQIIFDKHLKV